MPPKKKKRKAPAVKTGLARQHLADNFANLPSTRKTLQNGHVLYKYTENDRTISRTMASIGHLSSHDYTISTYKLQRLCKTFDKFRHLTSKREFRNFALLCREEFVLSKTVPYDEANGSTSHQSKARRKKAPPAEQVNMDSRLSISQMLLVHCHGPVLLGWQCWQSCLSAMGSLLSLKVVSLFLARMPV